MYMHELQGQLKTQLVEPLTTQIPKAVQIILAPKKKNTLSTLPHIGSKSTVIIH